MQKSRRAFTLIELLVVVLIIGILAAVAVPQYQKAVRKARIAEAKVLLKAIGNAGEVYCMSHPCNGSSVNIDDFDIAIPIETKNWSIEISEADCGENGKCGVWYDATPLFENGYVISYVDTNYDGAEDPDYSNRFLCSGNNTGEKICASLGTSFGSAGYYHLN